MLLHPVKQTHLNTWIPGTLETWGESEAACEASREGTSCTRTYRKECSLSHYADLGCEGIRVFGVQGGGGEVGDGIILNWGLLCWAS